MGQTEQNQRHVLDQTWNRMLDVGCASSRAGPVSTVRVKMIGTDTDTTPAKPNFGKTKRYPSVLSSAELSGTQPQPANDERDWRVLSARDVTFTEDASYDAEALLGFAPTMPAITHEQLGIEESGVQRVDHLRLALDPRDNMDDQQYALTPTLRVRPVSQPPLARAWRSWERQSPLIAIGTAATFCFLSALLVSMLAP